MSLREGRFRAGASAGEVGFLLNRPSGARWLLVLGHGAGAGMRHAFLETLSEILAARGIATFRYQFPYREHARPRPDPHPILHGTVRAAITTAVETAPDLPVLAGGKSMGGRMTSQAAAREPLPGVQGLVFFGFPLHAPGAPSSQRAEHLDGLTLPMIFLQGTRDSLADLELVRGVTARLGTRATLHVVDGGDHSFHVLKRSGRNDLEVMQELAEAVERWAGGVCPSHASPRAPRP